MLFILCYSVGLLQKGWRIFLLRASGTLKRLPDGSSWKESWRGREGSSVIRMAFLIAARLYSSDKGGWGGSQLFWQPDSLWVWDASRLSTLLCLLRLYSLSTFPCFTTSLLFRSLFLARNVFLCLSQRHIAVDVASSFNHEPPPIPKQLAIATNHQVDTHGLAAAPLDMQKNLRNRDRANMSEMK